jgi:predicted transposase YbfD/YdcC
MGCQKDICKQIVDGSGDFVIAAKDNQPTLKNAIASFFRAVLSWIAYG